MISTFSFKLPAHLPSNLKCSYTSPLQVSLHEKGVFPRACTHVQDVVFGLYVHGINNALEKIVMETQRENNEKRVIVSGCETRSFNVWLFSAPQRVFPPWSKPYFGVSGQNAHALRRSTDAVYQIRHVLFRGEAPSAWVGVHRACR